MPDIFRKVRSGTVLEPSAAQHNAFVDMLIESRNRKLRGKAAGGLDIETCVVRIQNTSEDDLDKYAVAGITGVLFSRSDNREGFSTPILTCDTPAAPDAVGHFAVSIEPIPAGTTGWAVVAGYTPVQINMTDATHTFADITDGDATQLTSAIIGSARILFVESGTGTKWALVRLANGAGAAGTTVISDVRWNDTDAKLQKKTIDIGTGEISDWIDIETAVDCP